MLAEPQELLGNQVFQVPPEPVDRKELQDHLVRLVLRVLQVPLEVKVLRVIPGLLGHLEILVQLEVSGQQEHLE